MSSVLEQALEEAFKLGAEYAFASTGINEGLTVTPVELNSNPDLAALKEAIKNQSEPVAYLHKGGRELLLDEHMHRATNPADWEPLYTSPPTIPGGHQVTVDKQGVRFGKHCWMSHEAIMGCSAEQLNAGSDLIGRKYMDWVSAMLSAAPKGE